MNWLAVILAALATMIVGALWYSPFLFGKLWLRYSGVMPGQEGAMKK
ncbi:MAG TPA: DUF1761 family protein [Candidatus Paceibacterota bacterium]|nr:DUF1761 family protein [Candidatus Paceibacterota bacterium]